MMRRVRNENWTEEETQALQKAIQHQSAKCETNTGSLNQFWEKVTRNVNEKSKTTRTLAQVKEKVKNLKKKNVVCPLPSTKKVAAKKAQKCLPIRKPSETENSHNGTSRNGYSSLTVENGSNDDSNFSNHFGTLKEADSESDLEIIDIEALDEPLFTDDMNKACENRSSGDNTNEFQPGLQQHLMRSNTACKRFFDAQETHQNKSTKINQNNLEQQDEDGDSGTTNSDNNELFQRMRTTSQNVRELTKSFVSANAVIGRIASALEENKQLKKQKLQILAKNSRSTT